VGWRGVGGSQWICGRGDVRAAGAGFRRRGEVYFVQMACCLRRRSCSEEVRPSQYGSEAEDMLWLGGGEGCK
jgi:hypothetical protein